MAKGGQFLFQSRRGIALGVLCLVSLATTPSFAVPRTTMGEQSDGSALVPSNQTITPIGRVEQIEGSRVKDVELSPDGKTLGYLRRIGCFFTRRMVH